MDATRDFGGPWGPGGCTRWLWRPIGRAKSLEKRLNGSGDEMETAPLQRVSVAQSDQRQLEGAGRHKSPGGLGERFWNPLESLSKRKGG